MTDPLAPGNSDEEFKLQGYPLLKGLIWPGLLLWALNAAHLWMEGVSLLRADMFTGSAVTTTLVPLSLLLSGLAILYALMAFFSTGPWLLRLAYVLVNLSFPVLMMVEVLR